MRKAAAQRLSGKGTFQRIFTEGTSLRGQWLNLLILPNGLAYTRFGCTVRRQVAPGGAKRNRIKRWVREAFRRNKAVFPKGVDCIAVAVKLPAAPSFQAVEQDLKNLTQRIILQKNSS